MPRPPEPTYAFTIPSIHDALPLSCRIYQPSEAKLSKDDISNDLNRGIVMAHPYAPMGGSYDDRVVGIVVDEFRDMGWVVGTFNFRGVCGSKGHTSWSGKPELDDYISFAAFFIHYMQGVQANAHAKTFPESLLDDPKQSLVILGGYSYGSLILKHLPPVPTVLQPFVHPGDDSPAYKIILQAQRLASENYNEEEMLPVPLAHAAAPLVTMPRISYLLVSPLTPPISIFATPVLASKFWSRAKESTHDVVGKYPSLVIYGDQDIFTSATKIREWVKQIQAMHGSQLTNVEVEDAGHFWVEEGAEARLRSALRAWETTIRE